MKRVVSSALDGQGLIDAYLGSAFDRVSLVAQNMSSIFKASSLMELMIGSLFVSYTATAGQTTFTGLDNNGRAMNIAGGVPMVYVDGVLQDPSSYVVQLFGTQVYFLEPLALGSLVQVSTFGINPDGSIYLDNAFSQASMDAFQDSIDTTLDQTIAQRVLAETAKDAAESAEVGADTARTGAETARNAAQAAQAAAEAAKVAAQAANNAILKPMGNWTGPGTTYPVGALVTYDGSLYDCPTGQAHVSSGSFTTDYGAGKWHLAVSKGAAGAGSGDMNNADNLSGLTNKDLAWSTLGGGDLGKQSKANVDIDGGSVVGLTEFLVEPAAVPAARTSLKLASVEDIDAIINGSFRIRQRGAGPFVDSGYTADRWAQAAIGRTVSASFPNISAEGVPGGFHSSVIEQAISGAVGGASTIVCLTQRIAGVQTYRNKRVTVLGMVRRTSGAGNIAVELTQFFGSGGTPSASVDGIGATAIDIPTNNIWVPFAVVIDIPDTTGKILGTNGNDSLNLTLWTNAGSSYSSRAASIGTNTGTFQFTGIRLLLGEHTKDLMLSIAQTRYEDDDLRCLRYYEYGFATHWGAAANAGNAVGSIMSFKTVKRATPTVTRTINSKGNVGDPVIQSVTNRQFSYNALSSASGHCSFSFNWTADAEL